MGRPRLTEFMNVQPHLVVQFSNSTRPFKIENTAQGQRQKKKIKEHVCIQTHRHNSARWAN